METVYQDLALIKKLDVTDNIFMDKEIKYNGSLGKIFGVLNYKKIYKETEGLMKKLDINMGSLRKPLMNYSGGQQQSVALSRIV